MKSKDSSILKVDEKGLLKTVENALNFDVPNIVHNTLIELTQGISGIIKSSPKDGLVTLANLAQRVASGQKLSAFKAEWEALKDKGQLSKDYEKSRQAQYCLLELLNFLDEDLPDEERFVLLKKIFLVSASEKIYDRNSIKPQQLMKLARTLSSTEVLILIACYDISKNPPQNESGNSLTSDHDWFSHVATVSKLDFLEIVANCEEHLMERRLITPRDGVDKRVRTTPHYRLTDLGYELMNYISYYDKFDLEKSKK
ncbi:hypothetical protein C4577_00355 [Candidatus Parcubacteria bacterium]|nr:MAG: hypothetical protein C4577_00355 [Candidatus Parcubacteria bacterium]